MLHTILRDLQERGHWCQVRLSPFGRATVGWVLDEVIVNGDPAWRPDLVIGHLEGRADAQALAARWGIPSVLISHSEHQFGGRWDLVISNTKQLLPVAHRYHDPQSVVVVWPPVRRADYETKRLGGNITLMNLQPAKGAAIFYHLARALPYEAFLAVEGCWGQQVKQDGPNIVHAPNTPDARKVYAYTRILLMPSSAESFGRVAVEAAMSGIPTIASPLPGVAEAMGAHGCVWADPRAPKAWEAAVSCLGDEDEYACHSARARFAAARHERTSARQLAILAERLEALV